MRTNDLIRILIEQDVKLIPQAGGGLDVDGPAGSLTPELVAALAQCKTVILRRMAAVERGEAEPVRRGLDRLLFADGEP